MKTYDPGKVTTSFLSNTLGGFADGTMVVVKRRSDAFTLTIGSSGEGCRNRSQDKSGEIEITLLASSASNDVLNAAADSDEKDGTGVGAFQIKDLNGTSICHATNAWIKKKPDMEFAKEVSNRVWVLETDEIEMTEGGENA